MPKCVVCESAFYGWSYSAPPEPCDCGSCLSIDALDEGASIAALQADWKAACDVTDEEIAALKLTLDDDSDVSPASCDKALAWDIAARAECARAIAVAEPCISDEERSNGPRRF